MQINFRAIVEAHKLSTSTPLLPLFEAIVNSIQSIDELGIKDGRVEINVIRDVPSMGSNNWETDIASFEIIDNGIGFNDKNYTSFDIYGSDHKIAMGCKGIGRVLWLKAFNEVDVESIYLSDDEKYYERKFVFSIYDELKQLEHYESKKNQLTTKVRLKNYFSKYKKKCPKKLETLARDIMNHCFTRLALGNCPEIIIKDEHDAKSINAIFKEYTKGQIHVQDFIVNEFPFKLISAKNYTPSNDKHMLHYCAHNREVFGDNLSNTIKGLTGKLFNDDGDFAYCGYITGELLDSNVNSERTDFAFSKPESEMEETNSNEQLELESAETGKSVTKQEIVNSITPIIIEFLKEELTAYNLQKKERIENYVYSKNPRYRSLIKHNYECIEKIPLTNDDNKLEIELFKQEQLYRLELKIEQKAILAENINDVVDSNYTEKCVSLLQKTSDMGKDDLADYIVHRKVMLEILEHALAYTDVEKKKYALEKKIHELIFPMTTTSDDIEYDRHNLWIIDEKLAYHYYLASDKPISAYKDTESASSKEPDITIFEPAFALTGDPKDSSMNNITIIEFKRPGRTDTECVDQVIEYIELIREGKAKDKLGRILNEGGGNTLRFNCYILCDIEPTMSKFLKRRGFKIPPDGVGYYWLHDDYNASIEVVPYNKLIKDSIRRNKILFDRLFNQ